MERLTSARYKKRNIWYLTFAEEIFTIKMEKAYDVVQLTLSPYLDENGVLLVGGRVNTIPVFARQQSGL